MRVFVCTCRPPLERWWRGGFWRGRGVVTFSPSGFVLHYFKMFCASVEQALYKSLVVNIILLLVLAGVFSFLFFFTQSAEL